jgi:SAM (Sterile alpha motif) domain-containing protein
VDVGDWLRSLGVEQYATALRENHVDAEVLPTLTAEEFKDIGVGSIRHRRRGACWKQSPHCAPMPCRLRLPPGFRPPHHPI